MGANSRMHQIPAEPITSTQLHSPSLDGSGAAGGHHSSCYARGWLQMSDRLQNGGETKPDTIRKHLRNILTKLKAYIEQPRENSAPRRGSLRAEEDPEDKGSGSGCDL
jgi:hypothetical protein